MHLIYQSDRIHFVMSSDNYELNEVQGGAVFMAKCAICEKGVHYGNNVSHSHRRSNHVWKSNIKKVSCKVNGVPQKLYVCTSCLRSGKVERV